MKIVKYIFGGYKYFGVSLPKLIWQLLLIIPVQITRLLFCFMVALFNLSPKTFFEAWNDTQ